MTDHEYRIMIRREFQIGWAHKRLTPDTLTRVHPFDGLAEDETTPLMRDGGSNKFD